MIHYYELTRELPYAVVGDRLKDRPRGPWEYLRVTELENEDGDPAYRVEMLGMGTEEGAARLDLYAAEHVVVRCFLAAMNDAMEG